MQNIAVNGKNLGRGIYPMGQCWIWDGKMGQVRYFGQKEKNGAAKGHG